MSAVASNSPDRARITNFRPDDATRVKFVTGRCNARIGVVKARSARAAWLWPRRKRIVERDYGPQLMSWLQQTYEPTDILFGLAEQTGIVELNGGGFDGPPWSGRYDSPWRTSKRINHQIGASMRAVAEQYLDEYRESGGILPTPHTTPPT